MGNIPKHNIYNNTFQIFFVRLSPQKYHRVFCHVFENRNGNIPNNRNCACVWVQRGMGGKNVFYSRIKGEQLWATNLQLPKSYVYFQKVKFGPITSCRPSQVTCYRRSFADNKIHRIVYNCWYYISNDEACSFFVLLANATCFWQLFRPSAPDYKTYIFGIALQFLTIWLEKMMIFFSLNINLIAPLWIFSCCLKSNQVNSAKICNEIFLFDKDTVIPSMQCVYEWYHNAPCLAHCTSQNDTCLCSEIRKSQWSTTVSDILTPSLNFAKYTFVCCGVTVRTFIDLCFAKWVTTVRSILPR